MLLTGCFSSLQQRPIALEIRPQFAMLGTDRQQRAGARQQDLHGELVIRTRAENIFGAQADAPNLAGAGHLHPGLLLLVQIHARVRLQIAEDPVHRTPVVQDAVGDGRFQNFVEARVILPPLLGRDAGS